MVLIKMLQTNYLKLTSSKREENPHSAILPEKVAIVACGLLVAIFAIPLLVVIQALSAIFWGITTVFELLNGKATFTDEDEL
jgi:hypothetical protein